MTPEFGMEIVRELGPIGYRWIRRRFRGKVVLVVGPPNVGKTTFIEYLCWNVFRNERDHVHTLRLEETPAFDLEMGRNRLFNISIQQMVDFPGHIGAVAQAKEVFERRPHAIIIFADSTDPAGRKADDAPGVWLVDFCNYLETLWRQNKGRVKNRIQVMVVAMNKSDKVQDEQILIDKKNQFRQIVDKELREARGNIEGEIAVMPCVLVTNSDGDEKVQNMVLHLAKRLIK